MPKDTWGAWLKALALRVAPDGSLWFTTHGLRAMGNMGIDPAALDADGFYFDNRSEQRDLDTGLYGSTATSDAFVRRQIEQHGFRVVGVHHCGYQDLYSAVRL
jgi:hypothetical protein